MIGMNWVFHLLLLASLTVAPLHAHASAYQHSLDIQEYDSPDDESVDEESDTGEFAYGIKSWDEYFARITFWKKVRWGIDFGGVIPVAKNNDVPMLPASTQKVVTAIAALKILGSEFRFKNSFSGNFDSARGLLTNPQFTVSGDPTWGNEYYDLPANKRESPLIQRVDRLARELKARGVKEVWGPILPSKLDSQAPLLAEWHRPSENEKRGPWRPSWRTVCYAVIPTPVLLNGNCAALKIVNTRKAVWLTPGVTAPLYVNLSTKGRGLNVSPVYDDREQIIGYRLTGKIPGSDRRGMELPIHAGENWLNTLTVAALKKAGIQYLEKPRTVTLPASTPLDPVDLSSPPLHEMLIPFVQHSINIVGDRLYLQLAKEQNTLNAEQTVKSVVTSITGIGLTDDVRITDGSGLRLDNQIKPSVLRSLLEGVKSEPYFATFFATLAVAGQSGTLVGRMKGSYTAGKVFGKTGTVNGVKNLVGYFQKADQTLVPFVFLTQTSSVSEKTVAAMTDKVLVEFARQNLGLAPFSSPSGTGGKKPAARKPAKK